MIQYKNNIFQKETGSNPNRPCGWIGRGRTLALLMCGMLLSPICGSYAAAQSPEGQAEVQTELQPEEQAEGIVYTDGKIYIEPLFEYPIAPEELPDLQSKSDYLMCHFWDEMDFSVDKAVDQTALNDAFRAYMGPALFASRDVVLGSVNDLAKKIKGHPIQALQFTKAAEEVLFGKRAEFWSDETYMPFIKTLVAEKKVPESRRQRYAAQLEMMERNGIGKKFPKTRLTLRSGRQLDYQPEMDYTLVMFADPACEDCGFAMTKLTMAGDLAEWISGRELEIVMIVPDAVPEDQTRILEAFKGYPEEWTAGIAYGAGEVFDIRLAPDFYIVGPGGKIAGKNLSVAEAVEKLRDLKSRKK